MKQDYDYRFTIQRELGRRKQRNPSYTLRSFARDLKISSSSLSLVLAGKQGLSLNMAVSIGEKLNLDKSDMQMFVISVKSLHSRVLKERVESKNSLNKLIKKYQETILKSKTFQEVSKWHFFAIIEYLRAHPKTKPEALAKALYLPLPMIRESIAKLQSVGILSKEFGVWKIQAEILSIMSEVPSRDIRDFHQGVIVRALEAIDKQSIQERSLASTFFAFDPAKFPEIQEKIKEFRLSLIREFSLTNENAQVYCLSQQLVQLSNFEE